MTEPVTASAEGPRCTVSPTCTFGPHGITDHPCGRRLVPGEPCEFCGKPLPEDATCTDCWVPITVADFRWLCAEAQVDSVQTADGWATATGDPGAQQSARSGEAS